MLNSLYDGTTIPLLQKVAVFGEKRQTALAANIANVDTPNYKRHDLPVEAFQQALRDAIAGGRSRTSQSASAGGGQFSMSAAGTGAGAGTDPLDPFPAQLFRATDSTSPSLTFQDNNNRSIEYEMMEMTKNNIMQNFAIELMNAQLGMLQTAIREQV